MTTANPESESFDWLRARKAFSRSITVGALIGIVFFLGFPLIVWGEPIPNYLNNDWGLWYLWIGLIVGGTAGGALAFIPALVLAYFAGRRQDALLSLSNFLHRMSRPDGSGGSPRIP